MAKFIEIGGNFYNLDHVAMVQVQRDGSNKLSYIALHVQGLAANGGAKMIRFDGSEAEVAYDAITSATRPQP